MRFIVHDDPNFCDLYRMFIQVTNSLDEDDPASIRGFVDAAFHEFINDGLHRPNDLAAIDHNEVAEYPDPVLVLNSAVKETLAHANDLDESLRLTRARIRLLEAVDYL